MIPEEEFSPPSPFACGLQGCCPRCGWGKLFAGFFVLATRCNKCGLDFGFADSGDGPAVFVSLLGGFLVLGAALWTELLYEPPFWVHLVVFVPLTLVVCLGLLRPIKGLLTALQFRNKAEQDASKIKLMPQRSASLLRPALATCLATVILVLLGVWQLHRLAWKEGLIAAIETRANAAPQPLPPIAEWPKLRPNDYEYRHLAATGTFEHDKEALVFRPSGGPAGKEPGYHVLTPLRLTSGGYVIVNRGFVPMDHKEQSRRLAGLIRGETRVTGLMRQPESRNLFTPADDPASGHYFTRDPGLIAKHFGLASAAPFSIDADATQVPCGWPKGGATERNLPNNHLSYALTWFGLALTLIGVFAAFAWQRH